MRQSVFKKLTISLFLFSLTIIIFMWMISSCVFDREFENYLKEVNIAEVEELFREIEEIYSENSELSQENARDIRRASNRKGYAVEIKDAVGNTIFESAGNHGGVKVGYDSDLEFELDMADGKGRVIIGFKESSRLRDEDLVFQGAIKKALGFGGVALLLLSLMISYFLSRKISKPILSLKLVAERIKEGEWSHRYISSSDDPQEIYELSESIDQMASTLKVQEELRKQLVSDMAHEIRTPIAVLKSHLEAMIEGVWEPSNERLRDLYSEVDMVNELVDRLKDIHMLESGSQTVVLEGADIKDELESIMGPLLPMFKEKGIALELDVKEDFKVKLDRGKLKQILYNLLLNSYKYSEAEAKVMLKAEKTSRGADITVSDTGLGISKEDLPYIFERFYRGEKSRSREYGGTGLGLTIVKALVEAHGWKIDVKSELGVGSEFRIEIPLKNLFHDKSQNS